MDSNKDRAPARHTLQPEYVSPKQHTERVAPEATMRKPAEPPVTSAVPSTMKPLPQAPAEPKRVYAGTTQSPPQQVMPAPVRPVRDVPQSTSGPTGAGTVTTAPPTGQQYTTRPTTQGSLTAANGATRPDLRLPSRGSYGQPVAPSVATTTAQGKVTQPQKNVRGYNISSPQYQHGAQNSIGQPMAEQSMAPPPQPQQNQHRRSSTLSSLGEKLFGRSNSMIKKERDENRQKGSKKYPPTAMKNPYPTEESQPRKSTDSKRSFSFGLRRKESQDAEQSEEKSSGGKRFSLLQSISIKNMLGGSRNDMDNQQTSESSHSIQSRTGIVGNDYVNGADGQPDRRNQNFSRPAQPEVYGHRAQQSTGDVYGSTGVFQNERQEYQHRRGESQNQFAQYQAATANQSRPSMSQTRNTLTKPRKFNDAYDQDYQRGGGSGAARRVQDFFRRRGRARADSEYR